MRGALAGLKGVKDVTVKTPADPVTIQFDPKTGNLGLSDLVKALKAAGYQATAA